MKNRLRQSGKEAGFSLVELMVASALLSLVLFSGLRFLTTQHRAVVIQEDAAESQQQLRASVDFMVREFMLIGFGVPPGDPGILEAEPRRIHFQGNVSGATARLSRDAWPGQNLLNVYYLNSSGGFRGGKTVSICRTETCERHRLEDDGRSRSLSLQGSLEGPFPSGSVVQLINDVEYELKPVSGTETFRLVRTLDGGAASVAEGVESMNLEYKNRDGGIAGTASETDRISVRMSAVLPRNPEFARSIRSEVHLRN